MFADFRLEQLLHHLSKPLEASNVYPNRQHSCAPIQRNHNSIFVAVSQEAYYAARLARVPSLYAIRWTEAMISRLSKTLGTLLSRQLRTINSLSKPMPQSGHSLKQAN